MDVIRHDTTDRLYTISLLDREQVEKSWAKIDFHQLAEALLQSHQVLRYIIQDLETGTIYPARDLVDRWVEIVLACVQSLPSRTVGAIAAALQESFLTRREHIQNILDAIYSRPGFEAIVPVPCEARERFVTEICRLAFSHIIRTDDSAALLAALLAATCWKITVSVDAIKVEVSDSDVSTMTFLEFITAALPYLPGEPYKRGLQRLLADGAGVL